MAFFFSTKYNNASFNISTLIIRIAFGLYMLLKHGLMKLLYFHEVVQHFVNLFHIGSALSLYLAIFVETFCSLFIVLGLFTRVVAIILFIEMVIAVIIDTGAINFKTELAILYMTVFIFLFLCGPGKISLDGFIKG